MDVLNPKTPEQIYKAESSLHSNRNARAAAIANVDSASTNLASSLVNGFVNAGK